jgi:hypothetical protein
VTSCSAKYSLYLQVRSDTLTFDGVPVEGSSSGRRLYIQLLYGTVLQASV